MRTFTESQQRALQSGWPHLREIEEVRSKKTPAERAAAVIDRVDPPGAVSWDEGAARAFLRAHRLTAGRVRDKDVAALDAESPLTAEEYVELLGAWGRKDRYGFVFEEVVLLGEALLGPDVAVQAVCDWVDGLSRSRRSKAEPAGRMFGGALTSPDFMAYLVGFPALRAAASARDRLAGTRDALPDGGRLRALLDLVLDGADAARAHRIDRLQGLHFAGDDPTLMLEVSARDRKHASLTPRLAWLAGPASLEHYAERMSSGLPAWYQGQAVEHFGVFAEPEVLPLMSALAGRSRTKRKALSWFAEHADFVGVHQQIAASLPEYDAIVDALGGDLPDPPPPLDQDGLDDALAALLDETAAALREGQDPLPVLRGALREHTDLRARADLGPDPRAAHFFTVDGVNDGGLMERLGPDWPRWDAVMDALRTLQTAL